MNSISIDVGPGATARCYSDLESGIKEFGEVLLPEQTHTANVGTAGCIDDVFPTTDALVTSCKGLAIGVRTADCVPILLNAPDIGAVAAVHAGWKGTLSGIVRNAVARLTEMGADPSVMYAAMGPCICGDCYEVGPELGQTFKDAGWGEFVFIPEGGKEHLDLPGINRKILLECGLSPESIAMPPICTLESPGWPSWRRDSGTQRRLLSVIIHTK